jgi:hypothetical protein
MNTAARSELSIEALESGSIAAEAFDHESHVYVAWLYLERYSVSEAIVSRSKKALRSCRR